jgi:predicted RNase H-like HicB family nuclease
MINIYTIVLKRDGNEWLALCLEMGIVSQGSNQEEAINKIKEEISLQQNSEYQNEMHDVPDWRRQISLFNHSRQRKTIT